MRPDGKWRDQKIKTDIFLFFLFTFPSSFPSPPLKVKMWSKSCCPRLIFSLPGFNSWLNLHFDKAVTVPIPTHTHSKIKTYLPAEEGPHLWPSTLLIVYSDPWTHHMKPWGGQSFLNRWTLVRNRCVFLTSALFYVNTRLQHSLNLKVLLHPWKKS